MTKVTNKRFVVIGQSSKFDDLVMIVESPNSHEALLTVSRILKMELVINYEDPLDHRDHNLLVEKGSNGSSWWDESGPRWSIKLTAKPFRLNKNLVLD